jgi:uncharacterized protein YbjT (DUF2867 family)
MTTMPTKRRVLLVGATGMLGSAIVDAVLGRSQLSLRVLTRPGKPDAAASLRTRGVEIAEGDVMTPSGLHAAVEGVDVVVSALGNDPHMFGPGHQNLIDAAERAGVSRLVPSDFSVDFFKFDAQENFNLAMRKQVAPLFDGRRVRPLHILNGAFMDTQLDPRTPFIDWKNNVLPYFGDGAQPGDFTSVADTARYVATACADPTAPEVLRFAGEVLTMPQFAEASSRGLGRHIEARRQGSLDDLVRLIAEKRQTAANPFEWIALQYTTTS